MPQENGENEVFEIPEIVTKEEYDKMQAIDKRIFKFDEDAGVYIPNVKSDPSKRDALLEAKKKETAEVRRLKEELKVLQNKLRIFDKNKEDELKKAEDEKKSAFEKYNERLDALEKQRTEDINKFKSKMEKSTIQKAVSEISELFIDSSKKMAKAYIEKQITIEYVDDEPVAVFNDDFGNKLTNFADIKKNLFADPEFKSTLKGVDAGGSHFGSPSRSQAVPVISDIKKASDQDLVDLANASPEAFFALVNSKKI